MRTRTKVAEASGRSKLRFVMLDADLNDGDLSDLMGAITNALRPAAVISVRNVERTALKASAKSVDDQLTLEMTEDEADSEQVDISESADASPSKTVRVRKGEPRQPEYVDALDMNSDGVSFVDFAKQHSPRKHARRYLVACAWFKDHGKQTTVNIDKMFTAYRHASWPFGRMKDWDSVFRQLRRQSLVTRESPGEYKITTVGLGKLQKPEDAD